MTDLEEVVRYVNAVGFAVLGILSVRRWRNDRSVPSGYLALSFGLLGAISVLGLAVPSHPETTAAVAAQRLLVVGLILYVWALLGFLASFEPLPRAISRAGTGAGVALAAATVALPSLPGPGEPRPWWFQLYVLAFLLAWALVHGLVAFRLWRAGRGLPTLPRRRARLLGTGALLLGVVLLPSASAGGTSLGILDAVAALLPSAAAVVLYLGYEPPEWLRTQWRRPELAALRDATMGLMALSAVGEIAEALLPHAARLLGGSGATLIDADGTVMATHQRAVSSRPVASVAVDLGDRRLQIDTGPYAPFLGAEEVDLLRGLGAFIDIAIDRAEALAREKEARGDAEAAAAELETLVFGLSHDLKSPVISLLGYLDYLEEDHGASLDGEARFFLERMRASAGYMQSLIDDLLELSRVGRVQTEPDRVDLAEVVDGVAQSIAPAHPAASVVIGDGLPVLHVNPVRLRQLVANLLENSVRHGGRPDITVMVTAVPGKAGGIDVFFDDDGAGISPEHRETVFGIFERLASPGDGPEGTGIGLAMGRRIAATMGGSLDLVDRVDRVDRVDGGPGTRFRLWLPSAALGAATPTEASRRPPPERVGRG